MPRYGLFAGVAYKENETLPNVEVAIPFVDFLEGPLNSMVPEIMAQLETFFWTAEYAGAKWEGNHSSTVLVPGVGTLANFHSVYSNVDWLQGSVLQRALPSFLEPGKFHFSRGTSSPYYNMTMIASTDIPKGMELFANFGDVWDDYKEDLYEQAISRWDYITADKILKRMHDYLAKYEKELNKKDLGLEMVEFMRESILGPHHGRRAKTVRSLLPATPKKVKEAVDVGGSFLFRNQDMIKSQEWLETSGFCVDTLEVKPSTNNKAGFGAFATRDFKEGDRIAVSPMILIQDRSLLRMYKIVDTFDEDGKKAGLEFDMEQPIGEQIALNYAFGHPESSILFLPTAPYVAYINHDSAAFNAYIDWSDHDDLSSKDDLASTPLNDLKENRPQLSLIFQITALSDIKKGDEIFMNYGDDWEAAWSEYERTQTENGAWPLHAMDAAQEYIDRPYPVDLKIGKIPYPAGVVTACLVETEEIPDGRPKTNDKGQTILQWKGPNTFEEMEGVDRVVCDLISRDVDATGGYVYTIKARLQGTNEIAQVEGVPHFAIALTDRPYTSDIHMPGAFRHYIEIDDHRFPQQWRDLRE